MTDEIWRPACPAGHEAQIVGGRRVAGRSLATWQDPDIEVADHVLVQVKCEACVPTWHGNVVRPVEG